MRRILLLAGFFIAYHSNAQSKDEKQLIERTYLLSHTIFGTKDSITLERLFASNLSYGHSKGKIESRAEAVHNISKNTSVYSDTAITSIKVMIQKDVAIVRYFFVANENKKDGSVVPLNFTMMMVWVKEKKEWKLMGRQAVSLSK